MSELRAERVVIGYDGPAIVQEVSLIARSGVITVILGANGAGKSTLAKGIVGLLPLMEGHVFKDGDEVTGMKPFSLVRHGVGYLPQLGNVFEDMTVLENLQMGGYTQRAKLAERIERVLDLFPDLRDALRRNANELSGGQRRMVAMARCLVPVPEVLILDEPTAGLAPAYAERVWQQVERVRDTGVALLVVEQSVNLAMKHADHAVVLSNGRVSLEGPAQEIMKAEELAELFVG
ncbi:MAG: ABC transporter ATP-binding protein [Acidimicrobiales bacterium]